MALDRFQDILNRRLQAATTEQQLGAQARQEQLARQQYQDVIDQRMRQEQIAANQAAARQGLAGVLSSVMQEADTLPDARYALGEGAADIPNLSYADLITAQNALSGAYRGSQPSSKYTFQKGLDPKTGKEVFVGINPLDPRDTVYTDVGVPEKTPSGGSRGKAQDAVDKEFAKTYVEWGPRGGSADARRQIAQLGMVLDTLERGDDLTGPVVGATPDWLLSVVNPKAVNMREQVEEVVQRNLRVILGAQFTEKEGERLISRAYNPKLDEQTNARRLKALIKQMELAAQAKDAASEYYARNNTLEGYTGKTPEEIIGEFNTIDLDSLAQPQQRQTVQPQATDLSNLSDDELLQGF